MSRHRILLALAAVAFIGAAPKDDAKDEDAIQGTWLVMSATNAGKDFEEGQGPVGDKIVFGKEGAFKILKKDGSSEEGGKYSIEPNKSPKEIDVTTPNGEMMLKGIYTLKGDDMKIAVTHDGGDRPGELKSEEGSKTLVVVLKREKA